MSSLAKHQLQQNSNFKIRKCTVNVAWATLTLSSFSNASMPPLTHYLYSANPTVADLDGGNALKSPFRMGGWGSGCNTNPLATST